MSSQDIIKSVSKKLKYYFEVKRLEDGFDLSGPDCPRLDHPQLRARPTLMYDGLHDRPLKHYFSKDQVRTTLTQFKSGDEGSNDKKQKSKSKKSDSDSDGREGNIKKLVENYMRKYNFVNANLNSAYYHQNKKGGRRLKPEVQGYGIPLRKSQNAHRGGYPVLRCVPSQYASKAEAHRLVNVASKLLLATETIDLEDKKEDKQEKQRPKSAPNSGQSKKQDKLPALKQRQRPQTSKSRREHKIYTVDPSGKKVFIKYYDKEPRRGDEQPDSAYSTRPGSTSPSHTTTEDDRSDQDDKEIKPWLRREMRRTSRNQDDDDAEWVRPASPIEPRPPPKTHVVVEQASPRAHSPHSPRGNQPRNSFRRRDSTTSSSSSGSGSSSDEGRGGRDNRTTQTGGELLRDYDPSDKVMYDGRMIKYRVHVHTGDKTGAGTKADVRITLVGDKGRTEERSLANSRTYKVTFQKGQEDIFDLDSYFVGPLRKIFIGHDRTEMGTDWYLDHVTVKDMANQFQYHINCDTWLSSRSDDKLTFRGFPVKSSHRFSQNEEEERDRHYGNRQEAHIAIVHTNPRVEQAPPADERTLKTEPTGSASRTSTRTQYSDRNHGNSSSDSDTSATYTTSEVPSSTRYRSKDAPVRSHVSPRSPPMKRSDNFFDQTVKEKDYSSVIESLSVTTDQDNRDDFDSERRVRPPRDRSHLGITVRPVEGDGLALNEQRVTTPVRGHGDTSDSSDDEQTARIEAAPGQSDARQPDPVNPELVKPEQTEEDKLFTAARYGDLNTLKRIIQDKPPLKNETTEHGWTVLHVATDAGHTDMVQWLTLQMTDLEMETPTGNTPMHLAASNDHVATMRILFAMGASVNSKSYAGQTPLHMAAESGHLDAVKYLVASRADLDVRDVSGNSAEDMAAISNTSGADSCHRYLEQCAAEQQKPDSKLADMRSNPEGSKRPTSAQSTSTVDSSTSSSYTSSSLTYSSHSRHDDDNDDEELDEKQKKKHDDEIMEKKRLYEEQQTKMADKQLSFMDSIRQDVN